MPAEADGPITIHYNKYVDGSKIGTPATMEVDMVIGADGANSRVAKEIDAGEYDYAIAFQERIRIPGECFEVSWDTVCAGVAAGWQCCGSEHLRASAALHPGCMRRMMLSESQTLMGSLQVARQYGRLR